MEADGGFRQELITDNRYREMSYTMMITLKDKFSPSLVGQKQKQ